MAGSSTTIKNVALAGASGAVGSVVLEKLVASGRYSVRVLRRHGSKATFPEGTDVVDVDFSSVESLKAALAGQQAVVSTIGSETIGEQLPLVEAAAAVDGLTRIVPSEFGSNLDNPVARKLPVFHFKVQVQDRLKELAASTPLTYTFVYNGAFLDWGLQHNFILNHADGKPAIFGDGETPFSTTSLPSVADAVVGVLDHPEETKNRVVYIEDLKTTQNKLLALAKEAAPHKAWEPQHVKIDDVVAGAQARLAKGLLDMETFVPFLFRAIFDPACGSAFQKVDNELLGVKGKTEEELAAIVKQYVK